MQQDHIFIKGAREHNLKSIDVSIPRNRLVVITGLSGSGKSSLAFDTLYAEGQRRYVESLSAYARQFLEQMDKPDVDYIEGLSPAISIEQRPVSKNPRSTVGTVTEIYDYLRLLYARVGIPYCYRCGRRIESQSVQQIVDMVLSMPKGAKFYVLAPVVRGRKGEYTTLLADLARQGFVRVLVDGEMRELSEEIALEKYKKHDIDVVVDRLTVAAKNRSRLTDSVELSMKLTKNLIRIALQDKDGRRGWSDDPDARSKPKRKRRRPEASASSSEQHAIARALDGFAIRTFSSEMACLNCGISYQELQPRAFSFNSPYGACTECSGLGVVRSASEDLVVPDPSKSLIDGAIEAWASSENSMTVHVFRSLAEHYDFDPNTPYRELPPEIRHTLMHGSGGERIKLRFRAGTLRWGRIKRFEGILNNLDRRYLQTASEEMRDWIGRYMSTVPCPDCGGARLRPESLAIKVGGLSINQVTQKSVDAAADFFSSLSLPEREEKIAGRILKEIVSRLGFLREVGLGYITLDRPSSTLSGGESQRIHLATQIGSSLVGVLYVLDEPSVGLHQRDNRRLLDTLCELRDLGNTVVVVEHDEETIRTADHVIDLGPGAGEHGGRLVCSGTAEEVSRCEKSLTGDYLSGRRGIPVPQKRRKPSGKFITIVGARRNNLKNINVEIPLGTFCCVTGVSGSGKSSLIDETLYPALSRRIYRSHDVPGEHDELRGVENIDKVIEIDQSPIGRTPRSNAATYTQAFGHIRELFAATIEARKRGYKAGRFSFNVRGGRCETCSGGGQIKIEMHFLPDVYVRCDACGGRRFNRDTLEVRYKGRDIAEVLDMSVDEALKFFENIPRLREKFKTLSDVGLGYIRLGQPATTLSGGEAQRIKLARELSKRATGHTLYTLDEPTTGLHFADIHKLLDVLGCLVDAGNTVVIIEHNLDVIKSADYIIDLGPEGGDDGGYVVASGTPEQVAQDPNSYTGRFLQKVL
ncbi:MAG TPA: excinuclease ABC subunit UvrA [bacterium]|nr:excinuclease ABC subunit UvrA [bacterium]